VEIDRQVAILMHAVTAGSVRRETETDIWLVESRLVTDLTYIYWLGLICIVERRRGQVAFQSTTQMRLERTGGPVVTSNQKAALNDKWNSSTCIWRITKPCG